MKKIIVVLLIVSIVCCLSGCGKTKYAKKTEKAISAIGEVSLTSGDAIEYAEKLYSVLADSEKATIENRLELVDARETYEKLVKENEQRIAEEMIANAEAMRQAIIDDFHYIFNAKYEDVRDLVDSGRIEERNTSNNTTFFRTDGFNNKSGTGVFDYKNYSGKINFASEEFTGFISYTTADSKVYETEIVYLTNDTDIVEKYFSEFEDIFISRHDLSYRKVDETHYNYSSDDTHYEYYVFETSKYEPECEFTIEYAYKNGIVNYNNPIGFHIIFYPNGFDSFAKLFD